MSTVGTLENSSATNKIEQEIEELTEAIRVERRKHHEYKILHEVAISCTKDSCGLDPDLRTKLFNILMAADLQQCMDLPSGVLLGLSSLNLEDLTYEEKEKVGEAVQKGVTEKCRTVFQELQELGINAAENSVGLNSPLNVSIEDKVLFGFKEKLTELQRLYIRKLQELAEVLDQMIKLKTQVLPEAASGKINACEAKLEYHCLKAEILNAKSKVEVFMETKQSMNAYVELLKGILQQQVECKQDIETLKELKEKYKQVSCREYSEILEKFLQYKTNIEKKRLLYNQLNRK